MSGASPEEQLPLSFAAVKNSLNELRSSAQSSLTIPTTGSDITFQYEIEARLMVKLQSEWQILPGLILREISLETELAASDSVPGKKLF